MLTIIYVTQDQNFEYDANVKNSKGNVTFGTRRISQIMLTNFPLFRLEISTKFFRTNYYRHCRRRWRRTTPTKPPRRFRHLGLRSPETLWISLLEMSRNCKFCCLIPLLSLYCTMEKAKYIYIFIYIYTFTSSYNLSNKIMQI